MTAVDYTKEFEDCVLLLVKMQEETPPETVEFIRDHADQKMIVGLVWHGFLPSV